MFTMEGESPYGSIEFENRASVIRNPDGSIVSKWDNVSVPKHWSQVATDIMAQKYFRKAGIPKHLKPAKEKGVPDWLQPSLYDQAKLIRKLQRQILQQLILLFRKPMREKFFIVLPVAGRIGVTNTTISTQKKMRGHFMMNYVICWPIKWLHQTLLSGSIPDLTGPMV